MVVELDAARVLHPAHDVHHVVLGDHHGEAGEGAGLVGEGSPTPETENKELNLLYTRCTEKVSARKSHWIYLKVPGILRNELSAV